MIGWDVLDKENQDFRKNIDGYHKSDLALMTVEQSVIDRRYQGGDVQKEKDESAFEQALQEPHLDAEPVIEIAVEIVIGQHLV